MTSAVRMEQELASDKHRDDHNLRRNKATPAREAKSRVAFAETRRRRRVLPRRPRRRDEGAVDARTRAANCTRSVSTRDAKGCGSVLRPQHRLPDRKTAQVSE